ncbi:MAG: dethiobiotin synthase [Verrucomicrobiales bacterium]|jgi:dethiobiotin synthetase|nr:dethiobiotin synthase [Verrucomicrobiales bacterium]
MRGIFVTGTGTGVGKTFVTAAWTRELRRRGNAALALKPIACGGREDAEQFAAANDGTLTLNQINPVHLAAPLSPYAACLAAGKPFDLSVLRESMRVLTMTHAGPFLVEGIGGWLVPLTANYFVRDWARELALPVAIVAPATLGMLNHTLLTIESVRAAGCELAGVIVNHHPADGDDLAVATNTALLAELSAAPVFEFRTPEDLRRMPEWMICGC